MRKRLPENFFRRMWNRLVTQFAEAENKHPPVFLCFAYIFLHAGDAFLSVNAPWLAYTAKEDVVNAVLTRKLDSVCLKTKWSVWCTGGLELTMDPRDPLCSATAGLSKQQHGGGSLSPHIQYGGKTTSIEKSCPSPPITRHAAHNSHLL